MGEITNDMVFDLLREVKADVASVKNDIKYAKIEIKDDIKATKAEIKETQMRSVVYTNKKQMERNMVMGRFLAAGFAVFIILSLLIVMAIFGWISQPFMYVVSLVILFIAIVVYVVLMGDFKKLIKDEIDNIDFLERRYNAKEIEIK